MKSIGIILFGESAYILGRNILNVHIDDEINRELGITFLRIASISFYYYIFENVLSKRKQENEGVSGKPFIIFALVINFLNPILTGNWGGDFNFIAKTVFIITSIFVGIREEMVYRGIIQNMLREKSGIFLALFISNILFTLMHIGFQPFNAVVIMNLFLNGILLGIIYEKTKNLLLCIAIHSFYDMLFVITPILRDPLPIWAGNIITLFSVLLLVYGMNRYKLKVGI